MVQLRNIADGAEQPSGGPIQEAAVALPWLAGALPGQAQGTVGGLLEIVIHVADANTTGTLEYWLEFLTSDREDMGGAVELHSLRLMPRMEMLTALDVPKIPPTHRWVACRLVCIGEGDPDEPMIAYGAFISRCLA